jgi:MtfA peptidase
VFGFRARRRRRLMEQDFPEDLVAIVDRNVPYSRRLAPEVRNRLRGLIRIFLDEKEFEGCGELKITDEIRLTIAGFACVLLLGGQSDMYPKLRSILVYPKAYLAPNYRKEPGGVVREGLQPRTGEAWSFGNIVLSWDDILRDAREEQGRNVVFHEFAHQLDFESGPAPGAPALPPGLNYEDWARVFGAEYELLIDSVERGHETLIDPYGATNPSEFFAVATECFFLQPAGLKARHRELYEQLRLYFRQDPERFAL